MRVRILYEALRAKDLSLTKAGITDMVWRLTEHAKIDLEDAPPTTGSLGEYLRIWERNQLFR
jgi:hypothetical protein